MRHIFALLSVLFWTLPILAQTPVAPIISRVNGQVATATYPDGREAQFWVSRGTEFSAPVPFKVSDNECKPGAVGAEFTATWNLRLDRVAWIWTKHPDTTKLNQIVMSSFVGGTSPLFSFAFITNNTQHFYPDLGNPLPKDTYNFPDLSWLSGMETGLREFTIPIWSAEAMVENSQTGISENRTIGGGTGIRMKPVSPSVAEFDGAESMYSLFDKSFALLGNVVTWKWQSGGSSCWISFKPNLGPANRAVTEKLGNMTQSFEPYIWGQDSLMKVVLSMFTDDGLSYAE